MFNKVLILSASAGAGHVRAADALEKAFSQSGAAREIRHIDVLNYTNKVFRHLYSKAYLDMVNRMPEVCESEGRARQRGEQARSHRAFLPPAQGSRSRCRTAKHRRSERCNPVGG